MLLVIRQVVFGKDGFRRALRFTQCAIDTFFRIDDQAVRALVETVHRAHFDAVGVLAFDTIVAHHKSHDMLLLETTDIIHAIRPRVTAVPGA
jgi:hypothetical protein